MNFSMFENMDFDNYCQNCSDTRARNNESQGNDCVVSRFPKHTPLAMSYTPMQQWGEVYNEAKGLSVGTVFPELNMPFEPEGGCHGQR